MNLSPSDGPLLKRTSPEYQFRGTCGRTTEYNPTPAWTFSARLLTANLPVTQTTMRILASLDFILLGLVFWLLWRTYGLTVGCCAIIIFGLNYNAPMYWTGGAFLRQDSARCDHPVYLPTAALPLRLGRSGLAYAVSVRVFPVLFVIPLGIYALSCRWHGRSVAWVRPFVLSGLAVGALMFVGGTVAGGGLSVWQESAQRLQQHQSIIRGNDVVLKCRLLWAGTICEARWLNREAHTTKRRVPEITFD